MRRSSGRAFSVSRSKTVRSLIATATWASRSRSISARRVSAIVVDSESTLLQPRQLSATLNPPINIVADNDVHGHWLLSAHGNLTIKSANVLPFSGELGVHPLQWLVSQPTTKSTRARIVGPAREESLDRVHELPDGRPKVQPKGGSEVGIESSPNLVRFGRDGVDKRRLISDDALGPVFPLLATVEAIFNLGTLGRNDTSATPMSDLFRGGIP